MATTVGPRAAARPGPSPAELAEQPPERRVAWLLHHLDQLRRAQQAKGALGAADRRLMWLFQDRTPRTLREIADELGLEQSTVNRQVNAALAAGLLQRSREAGQPAQLVSQTDEGQARFEGDLIRLLGGYEEALKMLSPTASTRFLRDLQHFVAAYEQVATDSE